MINQPRLWEKKMSMLSDKPLGGDLGSDETYDLLKDESPEKEEKPEEERDETPLEEEKEEEKPEEEEEKEEIDELEELEKELEEPEDDELEIIQPVRRAEILKKYPSLFKDFPYLEKAYYRERKYSEIFPSPSDAQVALEKVETLTNFEQELLGGDLTKVLESVKKENGESFNKIADNYLMALSNVDERAYHHVVGNIIRSTIYNMVEQAKEMGEKNGEILRNTAAILNQFVFGTTKYQAGQNLSKGVTEKSDREKELEERETKYREQKFEDARNGLETRIETILKSTISKHLDPKKSMTDYVRNVAEEKILSKVYSLIVADTRFDALKTKLWAYAEKNNYNAESLGRIRTAYLSKATTLLPTVIKKARYEALKGMGKRVKEEVEDQEQEEQPKPRTSRSSDNTGRKQTKRGEIPAGMSNKDFIMSD